MNFLKACKITRVMDAVAAGTTDQDSDSVDMLGYDAVVFIALFGTLTATQVTSLTTQESDDDSTFTAITGGATAALADTDDNLLAVADVVRPQGRYARVRVERATANAVIDGVIAIQYRSMKQPVTQSSDVAESVFVAN